jgi:uncharacterized protein (DUF1697 family)
VRPAQILSVMCAYSRVPAHFLEASPLQRVALKTWIALLRGVNVLGSRKLPMKDLAATLKRAGFTSVRTYIQSGNVVFQSAKGPARPLSTQIAQLIQKNFGFQPQVIVISERELAAAVSGNPFPGAVTNHKSLHLYFLSERPSKPDLGSLARLKNDSEAFALRGHVFYLHTPQGFAISKVRSKIERCLGVHATGRNWRTANQLLEMLREPSGGEATPSKRRPLHRPAARSARR